MATRCIPNQDIAKHDQEVSRKTILLAEKLGVPVVIDFSGCPGDSDNAKYPNWVTCPWPPDYLDVLDWQWDKKVTPYWKERAKVRRRPRREDRDRNAPGLRRLQPGDACCGCATIAGPSIGCNYDPSHMFWQGIDPIAAIRVLGDAIFHVHAKDTQIYERNLPMTGVLDTKKYTDERNRAWIFRTCGYGHGAEWWREFVSTLRMFGYDYVLSIEHEDSIAVAGRRADEGGAVPQRDGDEAAARRRLVGVVPHLRLSNPMSCAVAAVPASAQATPTEPSGRRVTVRMTDGVEYNETF